MTRAKKLPVRNTENVTPTEGSVEESSGTKPNIEPTTKRSAHDNPEGRLSTTDAPITAAGAVTQSDIGTTKEPTVPDVGIGKIPTLLDMGIGKLPTLPDMGIGKLPTLPDLGIGKTLTFQDLGIDSAKLDSFTDSIKRLDQIVQQSALISPVRATPRLEALDLERPEVRLLRDVHSELEGMAALLTESARQTGVMAEVTKANLIALHTVVGELQQSRRAAAWSNGVLIALTVAVLLATVVGAIAVEQEFSRELAAFWTWMQGLRR